MKQINRERFAALCWGLVAIGSALYIVYAVDYCLHAGDRARAAATNDIRIIGNTFYDAAP